MEETEAQKAKRIEKRNKNRNTVCSGCRHNYYNFPKDKSSNGDVAVPDDYSCWYIDSIHGRSCSMKS